MISFFISSFFHAAMESKISNQTLQFSLIKENYMQCIKNPITCVKNMFLQKNPIWIISSIGSLLLSLYIGFIKTKVKKYEIEKNYTVHGAARWGIKSEYKGFLTYQDKDSVINQFYGSINKKSSP